MNFEIAKPSVMSLLIEMRFNGQTLSTGTAFLTNSKKGPLLITNRHNVTGRNQDTGQCLSPTGGVPNEILVLHNAKGKLGHWVQRVEPLFIGDAPRWIEHPQMGANADFVALPLSATNDIEIYPYELNASAQPDIAVRVAEVVSVVGFPFGMTGGGVSAIWATGFIASEPEMPDRSVFFIDCRSRQGQSGSAVIAYRGGGAVTMRDGSSSFFGGPVFRLLGVYSGRINAESDLGIVWKASAIRELVETIK
jgi:hypothetical protein